MIHVDIFRKMCNTARSLGNIRYARDYVITGRQRDGLFRRTAPLMEKLFRKVSKTTPDNVVMLVPMIEISKSRGNRVTEPTVINPREEKSLAVTAISSRGGMERISLNAAHARKLIPKVEKALEKDLSEIDFDSREKAGKKYLLVDRLLELPFWASFVVFAGGLCMGLRHCLSSGPGFMANPWIPVSALSAAALLITAMIKKHVGISRGFGADAISENIGYMKKSLNQLSGNLQELVEVTSLFSR